jgi:hypothetical protein
MNLEGALAELFNKPVLPLADAPESATASDELDLLPESWQYAAKQRERDARTKQNLLLLAVLYLVIIAGAFVYLAILRNRERKLVKEHTELVPKYTSMNAQEARAAALAPAFDPDRFAAEVMHTLERKVRGNKNLSFTSFNFTPNRWELKVEGTTDGYFDFSQALKKDEDFKARFDVTYGVAMNIKDDRSSYVISGKPVIILPSGPVAPAPLPGRR